MHICPDEIMALAAVGTVGVGGGIWLKWKWKQFIGRLQAAFMFFRR